MNVISIIGYLGRDPEMSYTPAGKAVTEFSAAETRRWTKDGEKQEETTWFNVECWGGLAETCNQYLKKGSKVAITGRMACNVYEKDGEFLVPKTGSNAKQGGNTAYYWKLVAREVEFLDKKEVQMDEASCCAGAIVDTDDIPF